MDERLIKLLERIAKSLEEISEKIEYLKNFDSDLWYEMIEMTEGER